MMSRYYSYGASCDPYLLSMFRQPHRIIEKEEGPNDGLVSVQSSRWGEYKGTLKGVSHLDLIVRIHSCFQLCERVNLTS